MEWVIRFIRALFTDGFDYARYKRQVKPPKYNDFIKTKQGDMVKKRVGCNPPPKLKSR